MLYPYPTLPIAIPIPEWILGYHDDRMRIEVVSELALGHQDRVHMFLHL
jgi:hypothetical protein